MDVQCYHNNDEVYYTNATIGISKSNNNNYEWIQGITSHFNHDKHPVVSNSVSSQSIVWNVSLCDYRQWWLFLLISDLEDCHQLQFDLHPNASFD